MRRGLVLGCGGTVGGAWTVGVLARVAAELDWDPRTADVIVGTSSGSTIAAMLGAGVGVGELVAAQGGEPAARDSVRRFFTEPPAPFPRLRWRISPAFGLVTAGLRSRSYLATLAGLAPAGGSDPAFLTELARDLAPDGWVPHDATWLVGVDVGTGRRVPFGQSQSPKATLDEALRASWAIPGWYPPVTVGGRRYLDGGAVSTASIDLVADLELDEVLLIAPMASLAGVRGEGIGGRLEGLLRTPMGRGLDREITALESTGTRVLRFQPTAADLAVMGPNFMDPRRRLAALNAGLARQEEKTS